MKTIAIAFAAFGLLLTTASSHAESFKTLAEKIRQSVASGAGFPMDPALYKERMIYGHSAESREVDTKTLLKGVAPEQESIHRFVTNYKIEVTRFVASGDNVVVTTELTGTLPDKTDLRLETGLFFTIEDGRIARIETWTNGAAGAKLAEFMAKDPEVIASRAKK